MMFWKCKSDVPDTSKSDLIKENEVLKTEVEGLKKVISDINKAIQSSEFSVDFEEMNAFSIERFVNNNNPCTLIGYFIDEPVVVDEKMVGSKKVLNQWYLYCTQERHSELVVQFNAYMKGKKK
jgi:hypothetical protein